MKKKILIGILAVFGICLCFGTIVTLLDGGSKPASAPPAQTAEVLETEPALPTPTEEPKPTETIPATNTPIPTDTPAPTEAPAPTDTPDVSVDYRSTIVLITVVCSTGLDSFNSLNGQVSENPYLLLTTEWKNQIEDALVTLETCGSGLTQKRDVPPGFGEVDENLVSAGTELGLMIDDYRVGLENLDTDKILEAVAHMD